MKMKMVMGLLECVVFSLLTGCAGFRVEDAADAHWRGRKVAFLGDSISDPNQKHAIYWQCLQRSMGIEPHVYAVSGYQWSHMLDMARKMKEREGDDLDAILIFVGTNDYNANVPLGSWWTVADETADYNGESVVSRRRTPDMNPGTVCGRINAALGYLKSNWPDAQIVLMTPIHRAYAHFGPTNVQPPESFPNRGGVYFEDYVKLIREAADIWSVPVIDLYRESGLLPTEPSFAKCFRDKGGNDRLHPNAEGHRRLAELIRLRLRALPVLTNGAARNGSL